MLRRFSLVFLACLSYSCSYNDKSNFSSKARKISSTNQEFQKPHIYHNKSYNHKGPISIVDRLNEKQQLECARLICGKESSVVSYVDLEKSRKKRYIYTSQSKEYKDFDQLINSILKSNFYFFRQSYRRLQNVSSRLKNELDLSPALKRLLIAMGLRKAIPTTWVINGVRKNPPDHEYMRSLKEDSDLTRWSWPEDNLDFIRSAIKMGFYHQMASVLEPIDIDVDGYLKTQFPLLSKTEAVFQLASRCHKIRKKVLVDHLGFGEKHPFAFSCANPNRSKNLETVNLSGLYGDFVAVYLANAVFGVDFDGKIPEMPNIYMSFLKQEFQESVNTKESRRLASVLNRKYVKTKSAKKARETCHQIIGDAIETSSSSLLRKNFLEYITDIKSVAKKVLQFNDPTLQEQYEQVIDHASFTLPESRQKIILRMKTVLRDEISKMSHPNDNSTSQRENSMAFFESYYDNSNSLLGSLYSTDDQGFPLFLFWNVESTCREFARGTLSDHVYSKSGSAQVSWSSLMYPKFGIGVVAHELGHITSKFLFDLSARSKSEHFAGLPIQLPQWEHRRCINSYHNIRTQPSRLGPHFIESQTAEEDWSDYFSALILKELKIQYPWIANFGCVLMYEKNERYYTNNINTEGGMTYHAPSFFRVLHIESIMSDGLPKICGQKLKEAFSCTVR
jgi:hypothetical protein